jgi:SAM-dependent methyltransferase
MMTEIKQQVREFYDQVGWQEISVGVYQNASYEDLRPVSHEYIHRCHLRVNRHLKPSGKYLLDAGSGPIQYPEYLTYSQGYQYRVCADISEVALQEARKRMEEDGEAQGARGLFVVADIANLPFKPGAFEGVVSLHTIHHLPVEEHGRAYRELYRVLAQGCRAVVVNGWGSAPLKSLALGMARTVGRLRGKNSKGRNVEENIPLDASTLPRGTIVRGTYVRKHNATWLEQEIGSQMPVRIFVWRTFGVKFLRTFIHPRLAGRGLLRLLYWLEERFPRFLGRNGQYPLIVIDGKGDRRSKE